jgi:anti-sigma factor RsiW
MMPSRPTHEQLVAFAAGEMNAADATWIAAYLPTDAAAAREVAMLQAIIGTMRADRSTPAPLDSVADAKALFRPRAAVAGESWWQRATRAVAELVFDSRMQPALAGFRSSGGAGFQLEFESDVAHVDLQFEPRDEERDNWSVIGQVASKAADPNAEIAILLRGKDSAVREATADESGVFTFEVDRGDYDFCVRVRDRVMVLPGILVE